MPIPAEKRRSCAEDALKCYGTAYIFENRARKIRRLIKLTTWFGIVTPATLGGTIALMGTRSSHAEWAILIAGLVGIAQVGLSIWSLVSGWDRDLPYYIESKFDNYKLSDEFASLGNTTLLSEEEFDVKNQLLNARADARLSGDSRYDITDTEKRMGYCAGHWKFQRPCSKCGKVPSAPVTSECPTCGKF